MNIAIAIALIVSALAAWGWLIKWMTRPRPVIKFRIAWYLVMIYIAVTTFAVFALLATNSTPTR